MSAESRTPSVLDTEIERVRGEALSVLIAYEDFEWTEEATAATAEAAVRMARHVLSLTGGDIRTPEWARIT